MNEFYIIGRSLGTIEEKESSKGTKYGQIVLSVKKSYANSQDGAPETDKIQLTMFANCLNEAKDIVKDGTSIVVRGHISANNYSKDGKVIYGCNAIADRISLVDNLC